MTPEETLLGHLKDLLFDMRKSESIIEAKVHCKQSIRWIKKNHPIHLDNASKTLLDYLCVSIIDSSLNKNSLCDVITKAVDDYSGKLP